MLNTIMQLLIENLNYGNEYTRENLQGLIGNTEDPNLAPEVTTNINALFPYVPDGIKVQKISSDIIAIGSQKHNLTKEINIKNLPSSIKYELGYRQFKRMLERILKPETFTNQGNKAQTDLLLVRIAFKNIDKLNSHDNAITLLQEVGITNIDKNAIFHSNFEEYKNNSANYTPQASSAIENPEGLYTFLIKHTDQIVEMLSAKLTVTNEARNKASQGRSICSIS